MLFVFWHFIINYCLQIQLRTRTTFDESYVYLKIKQEHKKGLLNFLLEYKHSKLNNNLILCYKCSENLHSLEVVEDNIPQLIQWKNTPSS
jgi:hypothetical protein